MLKSEEDSVYHSSLGSAKNLEDNCSDPDIIESALHSHTKAWFRILVLRLEVLYNAMAKRKNRTGSIFAFHHCIVQHFRSQHKKCEPGLSQKYLY